MRVCGVPGCPTAYPDRNKHCPTHRRQADRARGTRQARGYGASHDKLRAQWAPRVATGTVNCARCHELISPTEPWALDHSDDRTHYLGPSHTHCNNSAGGSASHQGHPPR